MLREPAAPLETCVCVCVCGEEATTAWRLPARDEVTGAIFEYRRCVQCGTERILQRPRAADIGAHYPDTYYAYSGPAEWEPSPLDRLKRLVYLTWHAAAAERPVAAKALRWPLALLLWPLRWRTHLAFPPPARRRVFEIGAATGTALFEFRAAGWEVGGCEPSARACEVARRRGIELQTATAETAVLAESAYGCVFVNNVFEHLHDPVTVLRKARRALAKDGVLVLVIPNHDSWSAHRFGAAWPGFDAPRHLWGFSPRTIVTLLMAEGFGVERVTHLAPTRWSWQACIEGTRLPGGASAASSRRARRLSLALLPVGVLAAAIGRGDFLVVVARPSAPQATDAAPPSSTPTRVSF